MKTDKIIEQHLNKFNQAWFEKKLNEFKSGPFFKDGILENDEPIYQEVETFDYDDEGNKINHNRKLIEDQKSIFKLTFNDFAKSSKTYYNALRLLSVYGDTDQWLAVAEYQPCRQIEDIETASKLLADRLFNFARNFITQELYSNFMNEMIVAVQLGLYKIKNQNVEQFKESYLTYFKEELQILFSNYLEIEIYQKDENSLNFNLNLEEISALFAIILNADILEDNKKNFMKFASKHFKIKEQSGNGYVNFLYKNFQDRLNKQIGNKNHRENALGHISELLSKSSDRLLASKYYDE